MPKATAPIFQVKFTLRDSNPSIWRRVLISSDTTLPRLHQIIQAVMGWEDSHFHVFTVGTVRFITPHQPGDLEELVAVDARRVKLLQLVAPRRPYRGDFHFAFEYEYDFGDSWKHDLVFEDVLAPDPKRKAPMCIGGERGCPPEDVGGIHGYETFLDAIRDPKHPEHQSYVEWIGRDFDPEAFDLVAVNKALRSLT